MPCETIKFSETSYAIVCSRGRQPKTHCAYCSEVCERLCDFPVGKRLKRAVKRHDGSKRWFRECDTPMCADCAQKVYPESEFDFCKIHFPKAKAAYERKKAKLLDKIKPEGEKTDEKVQ